MSNEKSPLGLISFAYEIEKIVENYLPKDCPHFASHRAVANAVLALQRQRIVTELRREAVAYLSDEAVEILGTVNHCVATAMNDFADCLERESEGGR